MPRAICARAPLGEYLGARARRRSRMTARCPSARPAAPRRAPAPPSSAPRVSRLSDAPATRGARNSGEVPSGDAMPAPRYSPWCADACISRRTSSDHGTRWSRAVTDGQFTSAKKACCLRSHSRARSAASYDLPVARRRRLMFLAEMRSSADLRSSMYRKSCAASERPCMYACDGSLNAARSRSSNG